MVCPELASVAGIPGSRGRRCTPSFFCAYHDDAYPAANAQMGPQASLAGWAMGQDFPRKDGWSMYHGSVVPGFPAHPHRGFETVTIVRKGLIDHSDLLGATARFGRGDVQWLTAGQGIVHSEMFPLLDAAAQGRRTEVAVIAGRLADAAAPLAPPPDAWAAQADAEFLLLQGQPMAEPVVQYGPFVMNTQAEIAQTLADYQRTQFGGWPFDDDAPVHGRDPLRFAKHPDGCEERPSGTPEITGA